MSYTEIFFLHGGGRRKYSRKYAKQKFIFFILRRNQWAEAVFIIPHQRGELRALVGELRQDSLLFTFQHPQQLLFLHCKYGQLPSNLSLLSRVLVMVLRR
jgi:hypothetical protein